MTISIRKLLTEHDKKAFYRLPSDVYANDPYYIPSDNALPAKGLSLIACSNENKVIARCNASMQTSSDTVGTIGHFESFDTPDTVKPMLLMAIDHLQKLGAKRIIGPMNGDTWHPYRCNTGPFDHPPFIKEPWNPSYYPGLWEYSGFCKCESYDSYLLNDPDYAIKKQEKFYSRSIKQGYTFSMVTARNYGRIIPLLYALSCRIFSRNPLYTPVSETEFRRMYARARPLLTKGLSWLAYPPDSSDPVGFIFCYPDYSDALRAMKGKSSIVAKLTFLLKKREAKQICVKTLGVIPEKQRTGLTAALTYLAYLNAVKLGYHRAVLSLMHSSNDSHRFGGESDQLFRSYSLYSYNT